MEITWLCPYWGQHPSEAAAFTDKVLKAGYGGIEIDLPADKKFRTELLSELEIITEKNPHFIFAAQQVLPAANEKVVDYIGRTLDRLEDIAVLKPDFINAHTGKDFFSFEDNCRVIDAVLNFSQQSGIRVLHETHRGRFSFHLSSLLPYLKQFPELELTGDFSHFCVVSESLLEDQLDLLDIITPHITHLHARVGFSQAPQVNDPFAPEWNETLSTYVNWWQRIIDYRKLKGDRSFTITPEAGPYPYMPALPFTQQPLGDQWEINRRMKDFLEERLKQH
jgi:hypothetical protein